MKNQMKGKKGITLIALVITIIVLLILAGVTIATLTGDNGLLQKATTAKEANEEAKELELIKLAVSAAQVAGEGSITKDDLERELKSNFGDNKEVFENNTFFYCNGYRIYKDGRVEEGNLLPDEYQQVEYLESTGVQYIDTKIKPNNNMGCKVKFKFNTTTKVQYVLGSLNLGVYRFNPILIDINTGDSLKNNFLYLNQKSFQPCVYRTSDLNVHYLDFNCNESRNIEFDGEYIAKAGELGDVEGPNLYIFCRNHNGFELGASVKIYICDIYKDYMINKSFIPCYSKTVVNDVNNKQCSIGTKGLYDIVEGKFYANQGTGTFGYGMEDGTYVAPTNN